MRKSLLIFFLFVCVCAFGQNNIDSLLKLIKTDPADTHKVKHLYKLCAEYKNIGEYNKGLFYGKQALVLAQNLDFQKGVAQSYNSIGNIYNNQDNYPEALKNYFAALKIREEIKDKQGIAGSYNNIGYIYMQQGNYPEALKNHLASLKIREELNNKQGIASSYMNIGIIYYSQDNYHEALKNQLAAIKIYEESKDKGGIASVCNNIANIYKKQNNYPEALKNYFVSLRIYEEIRNKDGIAASYMNLGNLYIKLHKIQDAGTCLSKALQLSTAIGSKGVIIGSYAGLTALDSVTGNYKAAFAHHKLFVVYRDSIDNEETQKKSLQSAMQYEFDKKEIAAKAEQEKLDAITREEKQKQNIIIYSVGGVLLLVIIFSLFLFNRFRITRRQKTVIEEQKVLVDKAYETLHEKNKEVMDSINYASRIQRALITSDKYIATQLRRLMKND